jgi:hypothetical protein
MESYVLNTLQVWQISGIWKNFKRLKCEICKLPLLCGRHFVSSGLLHKVGSYLLTDFSGQPFGPIFDGRLRADWTQGMCAAILSRIFYLASWYPKIRIKTKMYRNVILPVMRVWNWSLLLRDGYRQNAVLRKVFWPKWDEVTGKWRRLHNEKLPELYASPNIIQNA